MRTSLTICETILTFSRVIFAVKKVIPWTMKWVEQSRGSLAVIKYPCEEQTEKLDNIEEFN